MVTQPRNDEWSLLQKASLQEVLDRVTDQAIQKIIDRKITPEIEGRGQYAERAKLKLSRATSNDQASIEALFAKQPIPFSGMSLLYDRTPDFFSLLRARGHAHTAIAARLGESQDLWGLGSMSLREGYFNHAPTHVAYLGDLRMLLSRNTARVWRQLYSRLLQDVAKEIGVASFLTAIVGENKAALRSLVTRQNSEFVYEPLGRLRLLAVLGRWALLSNGRRRLEGDRVLIGEAAEAEFQRFYSERAPGLRHGWKDVPSVGVPVVLKNRRGETKVVARLVSPDKLKRMTVQSIDWKTRALFQTLRVTGVQPVVPGSSVTTTYLSWVCYAEKLTAVERRHALIELIDVCLEHPVLQAMGVVNWMLLVPDTVGLSMRELGGRLHYSTPIELFEVRTEESLPRNSGGIGVHAVHDIGFEMALL